MSTPVSARISAVLPWSMWPAVPSVSGAGAHRARSRTAARAAAAAASTSSSAQRARVEQHPAVVDPRDHRRVAVAQRARERRRRRRRRPARPPGPRARAAAARRRRPCATARTISASAPIASRQPTRPRGQRRLVAVEHRQHRDLAPRPLAGRGTAQRRLERGQRQLVDPQRPRQRVRAARPRPRRRVRPAAPPAGRRAACRPSSRRARRRPRPTACSAGSSAERRDPGGVGEHARADVVDHRHAEPAQLLDRDVLDEPDRAEVGRVHAQDRADRSPALQRALARSRPAACGWSCRPRPASAPDCAITSGIRKPPPISTSWPRETIDVAAGAGQRGGGEQHGAGAVVDDDRGLGAGQLAQQRLDVRVAAAALAGREVELEVGVALARRARPRRARRPAAARGRGWCGRSRRWR